MLTLAGKILLEPLGQDWPDPLMLSVSEATLEHANPLHGQEDVGVQLVKIGEFLFFCDSNNHKKEARTGKEIILV